MEGRGKYEFRKSKRKVNLVEKEISFYEMLNFKKDICKDAILEY